MRRFCCKRSIGAGGKKCRQRRLTSRRTTREQPIVMMCALFMPTISRILTNPTVLMNSYRGRVTAGHFVAPRLMLTFGADFLQGPVGSVSDHQPASEPTDAKRAINEMNAQKTAGIQCATDGFIPSICVGYYCRSVNAVKYIPKVRGTQPKLLWNCCPMLRPSEGLSFSPDRCNNSAVARVLMAVHNR